MKLRAQILAGYAVVLVLMAATAAVMASDINSLVDTSKWVAHTHEVIAKAHHIEKLLIDMQTGQRGFLLAGQDEFLEPYESGKKEYSKTMAELKVLVSDNPVQVKRLEDIELVVDEWHRVAASVAIAERQKVKAGAIDAAYLQKLLGKGDGKGLHDQMRDIIDRLDDELNRAGNAQARYLVLAIAKDMIDMETGQRGFLVTGKDEFLEPFDLGINSLGKHFKELREAAPIAYHGSINRLDDLSQSWLRKAGKPEIAARRDMNKNEASMKTVSALIQKGTGKKFMDSLRDKLKTFISVEQELLVKRNREASASAARSIIIILTGTVLAIMAGLLAMFLTARTILRKVGGEPIAIAGLTEQVAEGDLDIEVPGGADGATGILASVISMVDALKKSRHQAERQDWLKTGITKLNDRMRGQQEMDPLLSGVLAEMTRYVGAHVGAIYRLEDRRLDDGRPDDSANGEPTLSLAASFAHQKRKNLSNRFALGEGLVGQCAKEKQPILLRNVPDDYVKVTSGLGESKPMFIAVSPFLHEGKVMGVLEIGSLQEITDTHLEYLKQAMPALGISVHGVESRMTLLALEQSQRQAAQKLQSSNRELEEQTIRLQQSESELKAQQEELRVANEELAEKNALLGRQKDAVEKVQRELAEQAADLAMASKYKSEFLANMSHELRTPLNSLLLLARSLTDNKAGHLDEDEVESATVIYQSGKDLLTLINEILDLSKIEAGHMDIHLEEVLVSELARSVRSSFQHVATHKNIEFIVESAAGAPTALVTDRQRLEQILKNLISNAIKFTDKGHVAVTFGPVPPGTVLRRSGLQAALQSGLQSNLALAISVEDTGIGVAPEKQKLIFQAFQQADGGITRTHGGTGLGLSISRELCALLGGEMQLSSELGKGSTFTVFLPVETSSDGAPCRSPAPRQGHRKGHHQPHIALPAALVSDDRERIEPGDRCILVIEDDVHFANILARECRQRGLKCLVATTGEAGLELAERFVPQGIILDVKLPGMDGWAVLNALKANTKTRHIPVHMASVEEASAQAQLKGAIGYAVKPIGPEQLEQTFSRLENASSGKPRRVLVVEDDATVRNATIKLISGADVTVDDASTGAEALKAIDSTRYDCVILDLGLPDMDGRQLLETLQRKGSEIPPIIIHTARGLTWEEGMALRSFSDSIVVKDVQSSERLLDEVSLFLHRVVSEMPQPTRHMTTGLHDSDAALRDKKVLLIDDDMRALFALSKVLDARGMRTIKAPNGQKALELLADDPDVDIVLTDIMMPVLDGYETIKQIRAQERFKKLPIIALTAKAMKDDRERCLEAGANDYLPKPVDQERLLSMLRVWLYQTAQRG